MKVLIISHMYPSNFNNMAGIFVYEQARALVRNGCEVKVVSPVPWAPFPLKNMSAKWKGYSNIPYKDKIGSIDVYYPRYLEFPRGILFNRSGYFMGKCITSTVKQIYKKFKFDVIHSNVALPDGYSAIIVNRNLKLPHVVTIHGQDFQNTIYRNKKCKQAVFKVLNRVDRIITVSTKLGNIVAQENFYKKVRVIHNGIDEKIIKCNSEDNLNEEKKDKIKILSVSNLKKTKGIQINLEAISKLKDKYKNIQYDIIGSGEFESALKNLVKKLNLGKIVNFLGSMEHSKVIENMSQYDIFSLPSYNEGFGVAYIEAMSQGLPVIGVKGEGIEDAIEHGYNGFLVKRKDVDSLVSVLSYLIENEKKRMEIGINAIDTVKRYFTWDKNAKEVIKLYNEII
ncbi:glycosyltransferase [Clostridium sp. cel8]|uniref:glycosyltransferase n=1 Tax=Clostridium sp. cel8 TaxID=2663123 RepID=UPI0015F5756E|nr:glycosyltransferase [Clostridium sp. cel8]MBA5850897.1 glycosyltransferase [Clostridium sp. cel8]